MAHFCCAKAWPSRGFKNALSLLDVSIPRNKNSAHASFLSVSRGVCFKPFSASSSLYSFVRKENNIVAILRVKGKSAHLPNSTCLVGQANCADKRNELFIWNSVRFMRTGFFRTDKDFVDPEDVLFSESIDEWRHADDGSLQSSVLERNNVGMGMLILNSKEGKSMDMINRLYRKLRDLEVNSLKRYVALTSMHRSHFSYGTNLKDLLMFAESSQLLGCTQRAAMKYLRNENDLSWLIHTYYKPLISLLNGPSCDSGVVLSCLANCSAAFSHSEFCCTAPAYGWFPSGGLSYVLARLRGNLGVYLALTGHKLIGADLVWSGMCLHWVSPEAFHFLELTSEKQLEVSERDAKMLLEEHFLDFKKADSREYSLHSWESTISEFFNKPTLLAVVEGLKEKAYGVRKREGEVQVQVEDRVSLWARDTLHKIQSLGPVAAHVTFRLIKELQDFRYKLLKEAEVTPYEYNGMLRLRYRLPKTPKEESMKQLLEAVEEECLLLALKLETRVAYRMMMCSDMIEGLRAHLTLGTDSHYPPTWKSLESIEESEVDEYFKILEERSLEYNVLERHEFPLSAFPQIRKLHPDFDAKTGLDHDPSCMAAEVERWGDDYIKEESKALKALLTNSNLIRERAQKAAKRLGLL